MNNVALSVTAGLVVSATLAGPASATIKEGRELSGVSLVQKSDIA